MSSAARMIALVLVLALASGFIFLFVRAEAPVADGEADRTVTATNGTGGITGTENTAGSGGGADTATELERAGSSTGADPAELAHATVFTSSAQCKECHPGVYEEWYGSQHERAWKNPLVAQISNQFKNKICIDCHAPRPVLETGLGVRVLARQTDRDDGVNCFSCHDMGGGRMASTRSGQSAPCNPVFDVRLRTVEQCAVCHNQHATVDEWRETPFAKTDPPTGCIECHMPEKKRELPDGRTYTGRDHRMLAGHDIEVVRQAPVLEAAIEDERVLVSVTNQGAAHNFPTDERHRAVDLVVRILGPDGELVREERDRYRNPYRDEIGLQNTQIPWGETRRYDFALGIPEGTVDVRLIYKLTPYVSDEEGALIFERSLAFP